MPANGDWIPKDVSFLMGRPIVILNLISRHVLSTISLRSFNY